MAGPTRTCIGCRKPASVTELVRLVLVDGRVRTAMRSRQPGRGASIHPQEVCVVAAVKTQAFSRAFRRAVSPGAGAEVGAVTGSSSSTSPSREALRALVDEIAVAHMMQQSRAGRTP